MKHFGRLDFEGTIDLGHIAREKFGFTLIFGVFYAFLGSYSRNGFIAGGLNPETPRKYAHDNGV